MGRDEGIEWGTVDRSDEPLPNNSQSSQDEVLEVPALTDDAIEQIERENSSDTSGPEPQRGTPGSQVDCATCGKNVRVRKDGYLPIHKCEPKPQRGNRLDGLPDRRIVTPKKVREFGVAIISWGVEEAAAQTLARPFGVDPDLVPTELPDAEAMIGPPLDLVWPSIPDSAQAFIGKLADNADLIDCALAWADWLRVLGKWTRDQRKYQSQLAQERQAHGASGSAGSAFVGGSVTPFRPN